jgi:hypothetical protein
LQSLLVLYSRSDFYIIIVKIQVCKIILKFLDRLCFYLPFSNFDYFECLCIF